eukprot:GSMAST32.ASY1.ANO1.260.1 assembled CDS
MHLSAIFVVNVQGDVVIQRYYRDDVSKTATNNFKLQVIAAKEAGAQPPIKDIYFVAVTRLNSNPALVFQFINNFTLVYELLDEVMDFGYPQTTSKNVKLDPKDLTGAVDWRTEGVKHKKNEIFIDVIEQVELLMSTNGAVLRSTVQGRLYYYIYIHHYMMKAFLSGMPECRFGLNDKVSMDKDEKRGGLRAKRSVVLDDCSFHRCVHDRSITFIPPDGVFELMSYRITNNVKLPIRILPVIEEQGSTKVIINLKIQANFSANLFANKVVIKIPVPKNTARAKVLELIASSSGKSWSREPVKLDFQVPMFTSSGMRVRFLKIYEKSNYNTTKWVRYLTKAGHYNHRI